MNKSNITFLLIVLALFCCPQTLKAQQNETAASKIITGQYDFELDNDRQGWTAKKSSLVFSGDHYKDGQRSLCWNWSKAAILEIENPRGLKESGDFYPGGIPEIYEPSFYPKDRFGGIKIWLYQEKPVKGKMAFQLGSSVAAAHSSPKYRFTVNLDFSGWRTIWVCFDEDAKVNNYKGSDELKAIVMRPENVEQENGKLFIDHLIFLNFVSNKRNSDLQFVNNKRNLRSADGYEILKPALAFNTAKFERQADKAVLAAQSRQMEKRLEFLMLGDQEQDWKQRNTGIEKVVSGRIKAAKLMYDQLKLQQVNGVVNGIPLFAIRDEHPAPEGMVYDNVAQAVFFPLAVDYRLNHNKQSGEQLLLALDYFQDQGWAAGSALGTVDHVIRLTPVSTAIFLMRDELRAKNKLKPLVDMLLWHTRMGGLLQLDETRGENSDKVRGGALVKLITILLMDDNDIRKHQLLEQFAKYMDHVAAFAPGYSDTFKPDYSVYHHRGTYLNAYGINALNTMAMLHWLMQGTQYAMSPASAATLKEVLKRQAAIAFGVQIHYGISGRFPLNNSAIDGHCMPAFAYMSMADNEVQDKDMAALFNYIYSIAAPEEVNKMLMPALTYSGTYGTVSLMVRLHQATGIVQQRPEDGIVVMPYSGLFTYRKDSAFATVKGYNKYVWDFEGGKGENNLGRYLSHGMLITVQGDEKKGLDPGLNEGYDWSMLPGATTKMLPADKVLNILQADEKYIEGMHRNFSESVVASGLGQGKNGLFAIDLRDDVFPDKDRILFDSSFRAKKSYFFIDNEIICLGSGIQNDDSRYATVTTLLQYKAAEEEMLLFNGKPISQQLAALQQADGGYFTDHNGVHYIVPKGQSIKWQQAVQNSYQWKNGNYSPVEGSFVKAWIDHGTQPSDKGYEYEMLLNTKDPRSYLNQKTYTVLQKNSTAHIIHHKATGIAAFAIFEPGGVILDGPLLKTDAPLLAQFRQSTDELLLTIAAPDIGQAKWNHNMSHMPDSITNAWAQGRVVTFTIKGEWFVAGNNPVLLSSVVVNGNTSFSVFCKDGESIDLPLQKRAAAADDED